MRKASEKRERDYSFSWRKLGVFRVTVLGTDCGYFVGWKGRYGYASTRNIRQGLYFPTVEAATAFRDSIEDARNAAVTEYEQVA